MTCELLQQDLSAYIDHELDEVATAQTRKHLLTCSTCKAEYESLLEAQVVLDEAEAFDPDPALWVQIEQKIARKESSFLEILTRLFQDLLDRSASLVQRPVLIGSLAALLVLVVTINLYRYYEKRTLMTWVENSSPTSLDLEVNPFVLQVKESLDENPFAFLNEASMDLNNNYFSPSRSLEDENLEKNPFST
jgi:hypothetical protein